MTNFIFVLTRLQNIGLNLRDGHFLFELLCSNVLAQCKWALLGSVNKTNYPPNFKP